MYEAINGNESIDCANVHHHIGSVYDHEGKYN